MTDAAERVDQIERQVEAARRMVRTALRQFLDGPREDGSDAEVPPEALTVTANDLERYAIEWAWLAPADAAGRRELAALLAARFGSEVLHGPATRWALQLAPLDADAASPDLIGDSAVDLLERSGECVAIKGGDTLLRQDELSADFYVVLTGRLAAAHATPGGGERVLGEMVRGTSVGELAALTGRPRAARVLALRDSHLLRVPRAAFERAVARFPEVLRGVVLTLVARERDGLRPARRPPTRTLALLPLGARVPIDRFARRLADELTRYGTTRVIGPEEAAASPSGVFHGALQGWLDGLEETHRFVVYVGEAGASEWTARCIRQADHILLVATRDGDPRQDPVEQLLNADGVGPRELVLLHSEPWNTAHTAPWLAQRKVAAHHHVRLQHDADIARLARRIAGRRVGLVLGGGGARAFAHIGALRALTEAGVPIDVIGGVSAGAIIAAQFAVGWSVPDLYNRNRQLAHMGRSLIDYTLPIVSLIQARKFTDLLHELFGQTRIEDVWLPFWCLSSNLTRAEKIVHRDGLLAAALRASCALPGVLPPVLIDGDVVVDGGLVDIVPVATMNEFLDGSGVSVAVDVSAEVDLTRPYAFGASVSGARLLWEQVNPFARQQIVAPSMSAVLLRSIELASVMQRREHVEDNQLFIKLPVTHVDRLAFDARSFEDLVAIGYAHTRNALQTSRRLTDWLSRAQA